MFAIITIIESILDMSQLRRGGGRAAQWVGRVGGEWGCLQVSISLSLSVCH